MRWAKRSLKANPRYIIPMGTLIAIHLMNRDDDSGSKVVKKIEADRRTYLRQWVEDCMEELGQKGYKTRLGKMFRVGKNS